MIGVFRGRTNAATFACAAGWVNLLFVLITLAFPYLLYGLLSISGCQRTGGACGALGLVLSIYIKPLIYLAYVLSFLGLAIRRLRDAGLPALLAFGLLVLMLGDIQWGMVASAPWSVAFVTGYGGGFPHALMAGLACVAALSMLPAWSSETGGAERRALHPAVLVLLGLLMVVAITSVVTVVTMMSGGLLPWMRLLYSGPFAILLAFGRVAVAATPLVIAILCIREWFAMGRPGVGSAWGGAMAVCVAAIAVGSVVAAFLSGWTSMSMLLRIRGIWQVSAGLLNWTALPELLALLVLPWLLRFMPSASTGAPVPPAAPPRRMPPSGPAPPVRAAFGRRGA